MIVFTSRELWWGVVVVILSEERKFWEMSLEWVCKWVGSRSKVKRNVQRVIRVYITRFCLLDCIVVTVRKKVVVCKNETLKLLLANCYSLNFNLCFHLCDYLEYLFLRPYKWIKQVWPLSLLRLVVTRETKIYIGL